MNVAALVATEVRLHHRHRLLLAVVGVTALWSGVLLVVPTAWRAALLPWLLLLEVTAVGLVVVPALAVLERAGGVTAARWVTRLRPGTVVAVRTTTVTAWAVGAAGVLVLLARAGAPGRVLTGVVLATTLLSLLAMCLVGRADTLTAYLARVPLAAAPLVGPALLDGTGLVDVPALALSPVTASLRLLSGHGSLAGALWAMVWIAGLALLAVRLTGDPRPVAAVTGRAGRWPRVAVRGRGGTVTAARSFARVDLRRMAGDRLLVMVAAGVPLVVVALRWFTDAGAAWVATTAEVEIATHLPALWAFVLALHVPMMVGSLVGLLACEDRDVGLLPALAATRATLATLAGYRLVAAVVVAGVVVAVAWPAAGAVHPAGGAGVAATAVAGGAAAAVPAALMTAFARDRAQGVALMKVMTVPWYAPVGWWVVDDPVGWLFALSPAAWPARAAWAGTPAAALAFAATGLVVAGVIVATLWSRLRRP